MGGRRKTRFPFLRVNRCCHLVEEAELPSADRATKNLRESSAPNASPGALPASFDSLFQVDVEWHLGWIISLPRFASNSSISLGVDFYLDL